MSPRHTAHRGTAAGGIWQTSAAAARPPPRHTPLKTDPRSATGRRHGASLGQAAPHRLFLIATTGVFSSPPEIQPGHHGGVSSGHQAGFCHASGAPTLVATRTDTEAMPTHGTALLVSELPGDAVPAALLEVTPALTPTLTISSLNWLQRFSLGT